MADLGTTMTDDRIKALMRRLEETYNEALQTAIKNNEKAIAKYASLTDDALEGLDDETKRLKREAFAREVRRTKELQDKIAAEIANAGKTAAQIIQGEMSGIYGLNYDFTAYSIQRQAGITLDFTIYDRNQLAVLTQRQQSPFTKIAYNNLGKDTAIVRRLQDQLIQATLNGESQQKIIRRIKGVTGQSTRQAKRVAQTERNRVQSQGRAQAMHEAAEMGLGVEKQWIARLFNTRESHEKTHLEIVDENNSFSNGLEYPGDPNGAAENVINCFCVVKPRVKSVSAALARHREKFGQMSFEDYRKKVESGQAKGISKATEGYSKPKYDFIEAKTIKEAETYASKTLGIPNVDFKGVDTRYANEWNRALADSFNRFPELIDNIRFTGTAQARNRLMHEENRQNAFTATKAKYPNVPDKDIWSVIDKQLKKPPPVKSGVLAQSVSSGNFSGVAINRNAGGYDDVVMTKARNVANKWFPVGTESPRSILDHEIGHQLDTMLDVSRNTDIIKLYQSLSRQEITDGLSTYAWDNRNKNPIREFIAEGWSEYVNNPQPRQIAQQIGETVEREYVLWKKRK